MSCCSCVWVVCCRRRRQQQEIKQNGEMRSGFVLSNTGAVNGDNTSMPVNIETTYMHASSAYGLTGIQLLLLSM